VVEQAEPRLAKLVEMRYYGGYSEAEIAEALGVTERTVQRGYAGVLRNGCAPIPSFRSLPKPLPERRAATPALHSSAGTTSAIWSATRQGGTG
jgi:transposase